MISVDTEKRVRDVYVESLYAGDIFCTEGASDNPFIVTNGKGMGSVTCVELKTGRLADISNKQIVIKAYKSTMKNVFY